MDGRTDVCKNEAGEAVSFPLSCRGTIKEPERTVTVTPTLLRKERNPDFF